ncbi:TetR/AcrR family transcriptional regulator [Nocardioides ultimimeridianus]
MSPTPSTGRVTAVRRRRRPTRSGEVLSEELIVRTAMRLIDQPEGAGFSVRALGIALGADPTAIYRYFRGTDDLMAAITDRLIGDSLADFVPDEDWRVALRDFGVRFHIYAQRHPRLVVLGAARVSLRSNEFRAVDTGIGLLRRAGFGPRDAVRYYHAFVDLVLGYAALDAAGAAVNPDDGGESWTSAYTSLPKADYPNIAATRRHIHTMAGSAFETALDLFLDGIEVRAGR